MKVYFLKKFQKHYQQRIQPHKNLDTRFEQRYRQFNVNPIDPTLKDHPLKGSKAGLRSFSITGDIRVVYYVKEDTVYFIDIGTHNQVY